MLLTHSLCNLTSRPLELFTCTETTVVVSNPPWVCQLEPTHIIIRTTLSNYVIRNHQLLKTCDSWYRQQQHVILWFGATYFIFGYLPYHKSITEHAQTLFSLWELRYCFIYWTTNETPVWICVHGFFKCIENWNKYDALQILKTLTARNLSLLNRHWWYGLLVQ